MGAEAVEIRRGDRVESVIEADVAVVDSVGRLRFWMGDPDRETYWRSCAKPFQAMAVVSAGAATQFEMTSQELALITASHTGEAMHVEAVSRLLQRLGLGAEALACGVHPPTDAETRRGLVASGQAPTVLHNNCSGKHTGMLALAKTLGADPAGYLAVEHPVQEHIFASVAAMTGLSVPKLRLSWAVDGCGAPTFYVSLRRMAWAYARLADPRGLDDKTALAASLVFEAGRQHPLVLAGTGRLEVDLAEATGRRLFSKSGAEAIYCVGVPDKGWGAAVKVRDGSARALGPIVVAVLAESGVLSDDEIRHLAGVLNPPIANYNGDTVGEMRPVLRLKHSQI